MNIKNILLSLLITAMTLSPMGAYAEGNTEDAPEETETPVCTMTFLDFDGEVMQTLEVESGERIDYSLVNTESLHSFTDMYTEKIFYMWNSMPYSITKDTTVQALYKKATIHTNGTPSKTEYYSKKADINLNGLSVLITIETQTPVKDESGAYYITHHTENITSNCYPEKKLDELFVDTNKATVNIIPNGDNKPIFSYDVTLFENLGDTNNDRIVDAVDASFILQIYADLSTGVKLTIDDEHKKIYDINQDNFIDAKDATFILMHYAEESTSGNAVWENIVPELA